MNFQIRMLLSTACLMLALPGTAAAQSIEQSQEIVKLGREIEGYRATGRYQEAIVVARKRVELSKTCSGEDPGGYAVSCICLALLYEYTGEYALAEHSLADAVRIADNIPAGDLARVLIREQQGTFYQTLGHLEKARAVYGEVERILPLIFPEDQPDYARGLHSLAGAFLKMGDYERALRLCRKAKDILTTYPESIDYVRSLQTLAEIYVSVGKGGGDEGMDRAAEQACLELVGICRTQHTQNPNPATDWDCVYAAGLRTLARAYSNMKDYERAESHYRQAREILLSGVGTDDPMYIDVGVDLAVLYQAMKKPSEALPLVRDEIEFVRSRLSVVLGAFPEKDREAFVQTLHLHHLACSLEDGPLVAKSLLAFKGAIGASRMEEIRLLRASENPEARKKVERMQSLRYEFRQATLQGQREQADQKFADIEKMEGHLAHFVTGLGAARKSVQVQTAEVQAKIPACAALIELIRYNRPIYDRDKRQSWESRYGAAVIRHEGQPVFVRLGLSSAIDNAVERFRNQMDWGTEEETVKVLRELYQLLLAPLESAIGNVNTLVFSPDSQLHFLCFEALLDGNDKMACEKWEKIRMIDNGRDLLEQSAASRSGKSTALLVGDPDYNKSGATEKDAAMDVADNPSKLDRSLNDGLRRDLRALTDLEPTGKEITGLDTELTSKGFSTLTLLRNQASEAVFTARLKGQRLVHLATHGFFLNELTIGDVEKYGASDAHRPMTQVQDPMLRSGLALAGANLTLAAWQKGKVPDQRNDGILFAAEAVNLDLTGTDLVVLSACETAKGKALDGEGIYGLRRALKMAGADTVVMTLWPVIGDTTGEFMNDFYGRYLGGKQHPAVALAQTKRDHLLNLKAEVGLRRALRFVGPFIATGKGVGAVE